MVKNVYFINNINYKQSHNISDWKGIKCNTTNVAYNINITIITIK